MSELTGLFVERPESVTATKGLGKLSVVKILDYIQDERSGLT